MYQAAWLSQALLLFTAATAYTPQAKRVHATLDDRAGWTPAHADGDIQLFRKNVPALGHTAWMGVTTLPATVDRERLFAVLDDTERHARVNPALLESVVIDRSPSSTTFYQVVDPPSFAPISKRWWITQTLIERDVDGEAGAMRRRWWTLPSDVHTPVREELRSRYPDAVEVEHSYGRWDLIPLADGSTRVIYVNVSDPGGNVPRNLATRIASRSVPDNMRRVLSAVR